MIVCLQAICDDVEIFVLQATEPLLSEALGQWHQFAWEDGRHSGRNKPSYIRHRPTPDMHKFSGQESFVSKLFRLPGTRFHVKDWTPSGRSALFLENKRRQKSFNLHHRKASNAPASTPVHANPCRNIGKRASRTSTLLYGDIQMQRKRKGRRSCVIVGCFDCKNSRRIKRHTGYEGRIVKLLGMSPRC